MQEGKGIVHSDDPFQPEYGSRLCLLVLFCLCVWFWICFSVSCRKEREFCIEMIPSSLCMGVDFVFLFRLFVA